VSLDGTNPATYLAIRGLDAFEKVCEGIRALADAGLPAGLRVTLQRANYRELPAFVRLARQLGARQVSFLAVDVANPHAFGRQDDFTSDLALSGDDLTVLDGILASMEGEFAEEFGNHFIAESPQKLRRLHQYFAAVRGQASYPPVRCNAPEFSAVIDANARVQPCFFIPGPPQHSLVAPVTLRAPHPDALVRPPDAPAATPDALARALNSDAMVRLRATIRAGGRPECATCVCSMWRDTATLTSGDLVPSAPARQPRALQ